MRRILFAPVLAAGLLGGHAPALAQGLPASLFTATGAIGAPEETMLLRRFALTESEGRMAGEHARLSIPVYLRPQEMGARAVVQIGLETAISVMPEASLIEVRFNDTPIGSSSLVGSGARRRIAHEVPQGLLRPGWNLVTLTTRQRHRVDCSTAATYELWSQIDPETSGLLIGTHDAGLQSLTDLASLVPGRDGRHRLRAVLPEGASAETVNLSVRAISLLASRLGFNEPVVDVAHTTGSGPGLDVIMGPRGQLAALGAGRIPDEGAIAVYDDASHERFQLVIAASGPRAASQAVGILERLPAQQDALGVLNAPLLEPQTSVTFAELGEDSREFDGRLYETRFQVRFPSDFFPSDVGRVAIRLSGAYAPGLSQDSQLTVRVNGAVAGALALGREDGAVFSEQAVYVSLAAFRPGLNMVEIEAQLVHPDDAVCLPSVMLDSPTRFLILSESSINVPRYPRIARVPRLTQGFQLDVLGVDAPVAIHIPHPDLRSVSAAATLFTRLALDTGTPDRLSLSFQAPDENEVSAIIVGALDDLSGDLAERLHLPRQRLAQAWAAPTYAARTVAPTNVTASRGALPLQQRVARVWSSMPSDPIMTGSIRTQGGAGGAGNTDLRAEWAERLRGEGPIEALSRRFRDLLGGDRAVQEGVEIGEIGPSSGLVIQQVPGPHGGAYTVVAAGTPERLELAMQAVTMPALWSQLGGSSLVYDEIDQTLRPIAVETPVRYVATQPGSIANWRLVLAGMFSAHPWLYTLVLLSLAVATALMAGRWLARAGQEP